MSNKEIMKLILSKADNEFTIWNDKQPILPSRLEIFIAGYLSGVKVTKEMLEELFVEHVNEKVKK